MIEVLTSGIYTTVQDQGRFGYRNLGVPLSGVMDQYSAHIANSLLGNPENTALLEITYSGPRLKFLKNTTIAIAGAPISLLLNNQPIQQNCTISINSGDEINLGSIQTGARSYLAIAGGFNTEKILNSRSQYKNITAHEKLESGDLLDFSSTRNRKIMNRSQVQLDQFHFTNTKLLVYKAPEFDQLDQHSQNIILNKNLTIHPNSNRMAYTFSQRLKINCKEIITSSVQPGTVQLTPNGELIVLMRDCQCTGGYSRLLQLNEHAINQLAQKTPGTDISFKII